MQNLLVPLPGTGQVDSARMSDIAKTLVELLAAAQLEIRKVRKRMPPRGDYQLVIHAEVLPKTSGGRVPGSASKVIESGDDEAALRDVLLEVQRKVKDWERGDYYPDEG